MKRLNIALILISVVFLVVYFYQRGQNLAEMSSSDRLVRIVNGSPILNPHAIFGGITSVDAHYESDRGDIFIVRLRSQGETLYALYAMTIDTNTVTVWPFGIPWWGVANERYLSLLQSDSIRYLIGEGEFWKDKDIWEVIESQKVEELTVTVNI